MCVGGRTPPRGVRPGQSWSKTVQASVVSLKCMDIEICLGVDESRSKTAETRRTRRRLFWPFSLRPSRLCGFTLVACELQRVDYRNVQSFERHYTSRTKKLTSTIMNSIPQDHLAIGKCSSLQNLSQSQPWHIRRPSDHLAPLSTVKHR